MIPVESAASVVAAGAVETRRPTRLFCFPYAGGGTHAFRAWDEFLFGGSAEICPVRLPGREGRWREPPCQSVSELVESVATCAYDPPFAFFGHSMGALLAFELARHLRRENRPGPSHLFVSGARAPQFPDPEPPIHRLPDQQFLAKVSQLNGIPREALADGDLIALMLPTWRADVRACETYVFYEEPPLQCPISVFAGRDDTKVDRRQLCAWHSLTEERFSLRMFAGDHFYFAERPAVLPLAISAELAVTSGQDATR